MVAVVEGALLLVAIAASLVIYFKLIDKKLDRTLDKVFEKWHEDMENA